jgi:hypothetical protein
MQARELEERAPERLAKRDAFGSVARVEHAGRAWARRALRPGRLHPACWIGRLLLERERRALERLDGLPGVPALGGPEQRGVLWRTWIEGEPLSRAAELPSDFFDQLEALVRELHARGVCHNDLHKEPNVLVGADGWPGLVDFQLASVHRRQGALFRSRAREDLRHVEKHRRRYTRAGRAPAGVAGPARGAPPRRSLAAQAWRVLAKPVYRFVTRALLGRRDGADPQRPSAGPWPRWTGARGPRPGPLAAAPQSR